MDKHLTPEVSQAALDINHNIVLMMGGSFVLGSFFTLLLLLAIDYVRYSKDEKNHK